jgi:eukaryotic-like serine/threonine-protein kinase
LTSPLQHDLTRKLLPELEVIRTLGDGSTAQVYLAREPALQRLVAVKILRPELAADAVVRLRFEREAQSAARITHPHVTAIHRIGRLANDVPYIVMEYIDGRTVREIMDARGTFDPEEAGSILAAVASALGAAHDRGIVHRDVRPENVFVENRSGRAVLADFGIAALLETGSTVVTRLTAGGVRVGEVRHMSPEQVRGEAVTEQSDVYAFGIFAYELLAGEGPYIFRTEAQALAAHLRQRPRRLRELRTEVSPGLATLIERCLAKEPNRRPRAREVALALSSGPGAAAAAAAPGGSLALFVEELSRRRVYQVLVGYGAVALAVLGGTQVVYDAFDLPRWLYRLLVATTLAGFPAALVLSWLYDITASGIVRTRSRDARAAGHLRILKWGGLVASIAAAALLGWVFLRGT